MSDLMVAGVVLMVTAPIQTVIAVLVPRNLGLPVLFRQRRRGPVFRPLALVKVRPMRVVNADRGLKTDADRLTPFGAALRSTSLDELLTLWNVLRRGMSLIGPRPPLTQYLDRYTPEQARRHEIRPGITGLAQVSGRNALSWQDKFAADVGYVESRTLWVDLQILVRTVTSVVRRDGIAAASEVTMPEFRGASSSGD